MMAAKTANVTARIQPDIKEQAEAIWKNWAFRYLCLLIWYTVRSLCGMGFLLPWKSRKNFPQEIHYQKKILILSCRPD